MKPNQKASDLIATCETCRQYAIVIGGPDSDDLFNDAWLKIRNYEIRYPERVIRNHKTLFYSALRGLMLDSKQSAYNRKTLFTDIITVVDENNAFDFPDVWEVESNILHDWLRRRTQDEHLRFLKNIVALVLKCKSVVAAAQATEDETGQRMSLRTFFKYLGEAKKEIDYEYFKSVDRHPLSLDDLVRFRNGNKPKSMVRVP